MPAKASTTITVGPPDGEPALSMNFPADGDSLPPGNIQLSVDVTGFIVSSADMGVINRAGEGHIIYYIDEAPPTDAGAPATTDTSDCFNRACPPLERHYGRYAYIFRTAGD